MAAQVWDCPSPLSSDSPHERRMCWQKPSLLDTAEGLSPQPREGGPLILRLLGFNSLFSKKGAVFGIQNPGILPVAGFAFADGSLSAPGYRFVFSWTTEKGKRPGRTQEKGRRPAGEQEEGAAAGRRARAGPLIPKPRSEKMFVSGIIAPFFYFQFVRILPSIPLPSTAEARSPHPQAWQCSWDSRILFC